VLNQGLHLEESCSPNLLANQPGKMESVGSYDSQPFIKHSITATISPSHLKRHLMLPIYRTSIVHYWTVVRIPRHKSAQCQMILSHYNSRNILKILSLWSYR